MKLIMISAFFFGQAWANGPTAQLDDKLNHLPVDQIPQEQVEEANYSKDTVIEAQKELERQGYYFGPSDGFFGPSTERALRQFQAAEDILPSGRLDDDTMAALNLSQAKEEDIQAQESTE